MRSLCITGVLLVLAVRPAPAATFVVDVLTDAPDQVVGDGNCAAAGVKGCTLRAAIMEANATSAADTIVLARGIHQLTIANVTSGGRPVPENGALRGDLDILHALTISGPADGGEATVAQMVHDRVFHIYPKKAGMTVRFTRLGVTGGNLDFDGEPAALPRGCGGGLLVDRIGTVTTAKVYLEGVAVRGNQAVGNGGGICSIGSAVTLTNATISNNVLTGRDAYRGTLYPETFGGGLFAHCGTITTSGAAPYTYINSNVATRGGGMAAANATVKLNAATYVWFNSASSTPAQRGRGGGLHLQNGSNLTLDHAAAGSLAYNAAGEGGGIYAESSTLRLAGVIKANTARLGGGVFASTSIVDQVGGSVAENVADTYGGAGYYLLGSGVEPGQRSVLRVTGGDLTANDATISIGGAIAALRADVSLGTPGPVSTPVTVSANRATHGGGISIASSTLACYDGSRIERNVATHTGGGISSNGDGSILLEGCVVGGNRTGREGGGIHASGTAVFAVESTISENMVSASDAAMVSGGGLYCGAQCELIRSTISANQAVNAGGGPAHGGGIVVGAQATLTVTGGRVDGNLARSGTVAAGGGIASYGGTIAGEVVIHGNTASSSGWARGGGIYQMSASPQTFGLAIDRSTLYLNQASAPGAIADGGGIYVGQGRLGLINVVLHGNVAAGNGGGIFYAQPAAFASMPARLSSVTITGNVADSDRVNGGHGGGVYISQDTNPTSPMRLRNSILASNDDLTPDGAGADRARDCWAYGRSTGSALVADSPAVGGVPTNIVSFLLFENGARACVELAGTFPAPAVQQVDPLLGPLQFHGGPAGLLARAPTPGSPAIDRGDNTGGHCVSHTGSATLIDLRGLARPAGPAPSRCDIGAVEVNWMYVDAASRAEGNFGSNPVPVTVRLERPQPIGLMTSSHWSTVNGSAKSGIDYHGGGGRLEIPPGQTTVTLMINVIGDNTFEPDEDLLVSLTGLDGANVYGTSLGIVRLVNDDPMPHLSIAAPAPQPEGNDAGSVTFRVSLTGASAQTITVAYATSNVTATAGSDYTAASGVLTFAPGTAEQTIRVVISGDRMDEADETFRVSLSNPSAASVHVGSAEATIQDDDPAPM